MLCFVLPGALQAQVVGAGTKRAFLVACGDQHLDKNLNLPKAVEDMEKFRQSLLRTGFKEEDITFMQGKAGVELHFQPMRKAIMDKLGLEVKGLNPGDTLIVALNGHGIHPKGAKTSYFVPLDGEIGKEKTLIAMDGEDSVYGMLREAQKKKAQVLLVVGACRNDIKGNVQALNQIDLEDPDVPPVGVAAVYSCGVGQKTYFGEKVGSYFYEHLSKAWLGEYHPEKEKITLEMVVDAVSDKTFRDVKLLHNSDQKPEMRREYQGDWLVTRNDLGLIRDYEEQAGFRKKGLFEQAKANVKQQSQVRIKVWKNSAQQGSVEAMVLYGKCLFEGFNTEADKGEAFNLYKKAADLGHAEALNDLGYFFYQTGLVVEKDSAKAFVCYEKAANLGDRPAMINLSGAYLKGEGVVKDEKKAFFWCKKAADLGFSFGLNNLAYYFYRTGLVVAKDESKAFELFTKAAEMGNPAAMVNLGSSYEDGTGVEKDSREAFRWFKKAADLEFDIGMVHLGACYQDGKGVAKNEKEAFRWFQKSSELGNATAMVRLGACYQDGKGVTKNQKEAAQWFTKAANLGRADAMARIGGCYFQGNGVAKDEKEAFKWFTKGAKLGDPLAMSGLGACYFEGKGVAKNRNEAFSWFAKAADLGDAFAMLQVGACHENGFGCQKDLSKAIFWYRNAASKGQNDGKLELKRLGYNE